MVTVEICIGSACYVKGSSQVVKDLQELIKKNGWENDVELKGSFCMKSCQHNEGLGIRVNGEMIKDVTYQDAALKVEQKIKELQAV